MLNSLVVALGGVLGALGPKTLAIGADDRKE